MCFYSMRYGILLWLLMISLVYAQSEPIWANDLDWSLLTSLNISESSEELMLRASNQQVQSYFSNQRFEELTDPNMFSKNEKILLEKVKPFWVDDQDWSTLSSVDVAKALPFFLVTTSVRQAKSYFGQERFVPLDPHQLNLHEELILEKVWAAQIGLVEEVYDTDELGEPVVSLPLGTGKDVFRKPLIPLGLADRGIAVDANGCDSWFGGDPYGVSQPLLNLISKRGSSLRLCGRLVACSAYAACAAQFPCNGCHVAVKKEPSNKCHISGKGSFPPQCNFGAPKVNGPDCLKSCREFVHTGPLPGYPRGCHGFGLEKRQEFLKLLVMSKNPVSPNAPCRSVPESELEDCQFLFANKTDLIIESWNRSVESVMDGYVNHSAAEQFAQRLKADQLVANLSSVLDPLSRECWSSKQTDVLQYRFKSAFATLREKYHVYYSAQKNYVVDMVPLQFLLGGAVFGSFVPDLGKLVMTVGQVNALLQGARSRLLPIFSSELASFDSVVLAKSWNPPNMTKQLGIEILPNIRADSGFLPNSSVGSNPMDLGSSVSLLSDVLWFGGGVNKQGRVLLVGSGGTQPSLFRSGDAVFSNVNMLSFGSGQCEMLVLGSLTCNTVGKGNLTVPTNRRGPAVSGGVQVLSDALIISGLSDNNAAIEIATADGFRSVVLLGSRKSVEVVPVGVVFSKQGLLNQSMILPRQGSDRLKIQLTDDVIVADYATYTTTRVPYDSVADEVLIHSLITGAVLSFGEDYPEYRKRPSREELEFSGQFDFVVGFPHQAFPGRNVYGLLSNNFVQVNLFKDSRIDMQGQAAFVTSVVEDGNIPRGSSLMVYDRNLGVKSILKYLLNGRNHYDVTVADGVVRNSFGRFIESSFGIPDTTLISSQRQVVYAEYP